MFICAISKSSIQIKNLTAKGFEIRLHPKMCTKFSLFAQWQQLFIGDNLTCEGSYCGSALCSRLIVFNLMARTGDQIKFVCEALGHVLKRTSTPHLTNESWLNK